MDRASREASDGRCQVLQRRDGLLQTLGGLAIGGSRDRLRAGLAQILDGLLPRLAPQIVKTHGEALRGRRLGVQRLDRFRDRPVQQGTAGRQQLAVHDLANALVHEVEMVAHVLEHLTPDQLLDGLRHLELAGSRRVPEERERERLPDDGAHRRQLAAESAEVLEPA